MLALSLLHSVVSIDLSQSWLHYMHMNGYLQTLCSSVQLDDANVQRALKPTPEPLRALYIYESKMAFLSGVAKMPLGCKYLLHSNCLMHLSECQFLDMFPNLEAHHGYISLLSQPVGVVDDQFVPTVIDRYNNQMLRPALSLVVTLITSSGPHKQETILQVQYVAILVVTVAACIVRNLYLLVMFFTYDCIILIYFFVSKGFTFCFGSLGFVWYHSQRSHELHAIGISGGTGTHYITNIPLWHWSEYH